MKGRFGTITRFAAGFCIALGVGLLPDVGSPGYSTHKAQAQTASKNQKEKKTTMTTTASGTFDVKMTPQSPDAKAAGPTVGKFSLDKKFQGDLAGTSTGEMLAISTAIEGSAGYVAMEQVTGTLSGRTGTFALQHTGTMNRGTPQLSITVVPDSGTGQLVGLAGKMDIKIADGKHFYSFEYTLAEAQGAIQ